MTNSLVDPEQAALGAALQSADVLAQIGGILRGEDDFANPAHRTIYRAMLALRRAGTPVDPVTLGAALTKSRELSKIGGGPYLHTLIAGVPTIATGPYYARLVRDAADRRLLTELSQRLASAGESSTVEERDLVLADVRRRLEVLDDPDVAEVDASTHRIKLTRAADIRLRPVVWAWEDRIPAGTIALIPGREGIGKSLALVWLTANLTRGTLPGIHHGTPRPVFYAATEDSWEHTIAPRLVAAGADLDLVYRVEVEQVLSGSTWPLMLPRDCGLLTAEMKRLDVAMLALDPLMSVIAAGIDTHRDRELRTALDPLARLADETDAAVVALAHFNKSSSSDASNLITGSRAFSAVARAVISIARDAESEDGTCILSQTKNNLGRLDLPNLTYVIDATTVETDEGDAHVGRLRFTGESDRSVSDVLSAGTGGDGDDRQDRASADDFLRQVLGNGPRLSRDVDEEAGVLGISESTLKRAKRRLGVTAHQIRNEQRNKNEWWVELPANHPESG